MTSTHAPGTFGELYSDMMLSIECSVESVEIPEQEERMNEQAMKIMKLNNGSEIFIFNVPL